MSLLSTLNLEKKKIVIIVKNSEIIAEILKNLSNHEVFVTEDEIITSKRSFRNSTSLHINKHRFFFLARRRCALSFNCNDEAIFRLFKELKIYSFISRRQFRVFVNKNRTWMLDDIFTNDTLINNEKIHHQQITLHFENSNVISMSFLHFNLYIFFFENIISSIVEEIANKITSFDEKIIETLHLDVELKTQTRTRIFVDELTASTFKKSFTISQRYHFLFVSLNSNNISVKKLIKKKNDKHVVKKFYNDVVERRQAS